MLVDFRHNRRIPLLPERIGRAVTDWAKIDIDILHNWLRKKGQYEPGHFWKEVTDSICSETRGKHGITDQTETINRWLESEFGRGNKYQLEQLAEFILEGRGAILDSLSKKRLDPEQRRELNRVYRTLFENEVMQRGWEGVYIQFLNDIDKPNSTVFGSLANGINHPVYGAAGEEPIVNSDETRHLFLDELNGFVDWVKGRNELDGFSPQIKAKIIEEARKSLIPQIKQDNPKTIKAYTSAYLNVVNKLSDGYGEIMANRLTKKYERRLPASPEGIPQEVTDMLFIKAETPAILESIEKLLTDKTVGAGGRKDEILESTINLLRSIADSIQSRNNPTIEAAFYETVTERLLPILKETKNPRIADLYKEFATQRLVNGQERLAFINTDPSRIEKEAEKLIARMSDPDYGIGTETSMNLEDAFNKEYDRFLDVVSKLTTEVQKRVFNTIQTQIKTKVVEVIKGKKDKKVADKLIKNVYDAAYAKLTESAKIADLEAMFTPLTEQDLKIVRVEVTKDLKQLKALEPDYLTPEQLTLFEHYRQALIMGVKEQKETPELREKIFKQAVEQQVEAGMRATWNNLVTDITDPDYGANGVIFDVSDQLIRRFDRIRDQVEGLTPEQQFLFYNVGREVLLLSLKNDKLLQKPAVVLEFKKLLNKNGAADGAKALEKGKAHEADLFRKGAENAVKRITEIISSLDSGKTQIEKLSKRVKGILTASIILVDGKPTGFDKEKAKKLATESFMEQYWTEYLTFQYDKALGKGAEGDVYEELQTEHTALLDRLKSFDIDITGSFLTAGIKSIAQFAKTTENPDIQNKLASKVLYLLTESPIATEMKVKEKQAEAGKFKLTLGKIQAEFIRTVAKNDAFSKALRNWISSGIEERGDSEERLCLTAINFSNDDKMRFGIEWVDPADKKKGYKLILPSKEKLLKFDRNFTMTFEDITQLLQEGNENAMFSSLAAITVFSPWTMLRIAALAKPKSAVKNTRQMTDEIVVIQRKIWSSNLTPEEKVSKLYELTGKLGFDAEAINPYIDSPELAQDLAEAVILKDGKTNILEYYLKFKDDICQISSPPGIATLFSEEWPEGNLKSRQYMFEKYLATVEMRIRDKKINADPDLSKKAALEFLALSMFFEKTPGEAENMKTLRAASVFSELLTSILTSKSGEFNESIVKRAQEIIKFSVPYWSIDRIKTFTEALIRKTKNQDGEWIENDQWKSILKCLAVVQDQVIPRVGETKDGIRKEVAKVVSEATLDILKGYRTLSGRNRLRSVFKIVTGKELVWTAGRYIEVDTKNGTDFVNQAISMVLKYNDPDNVKELKKIMEDLGREELLLYAISKLSPEVPQGEYLNQSKQLLGELAKRTKEAQATLREVLHETLQLSNPLLKVEGDTIIGLPEDSKLLAAIKAKGDAELEQLKIRFKKITTAADEAKQSAFDSIKTSFDWKSLVTEIEDKTTAAAGNKIDLEGVLKKLGEIIGPAAVEGILKQLSQQGGDKTAGGSKRIELNDFGKILGVILASQQSIGDSVTGLAEKILEERGEVRQVITELLEKLGVFATDTEKEGFRTVTAQAIRQILDADNRDLSGALVANSALEAARAESLKVIAELEKKYVTDRIPAMGKVSEMEVQLIEKEIAQLKEEVESKYANRGKLITQLTEQSKADGVAIAEMSAEYATAVRTDVKKFNAFLRSIEGRRSATDSVATEEPEFLTAKAKSYVDALADYGVNFVLDRTRLKITGLEVLEAMNLDQEYAELLKAAGIKVKVKDGNVSEVSGTLRVIQPL